MSQKQETIKKNLIGTLGKLAKEVTSDSNSSGWPPVCLGILYQPKRPTKVEETKG